MVMIAFPAPAGVLAGQPLDTLRIRMQQARSQHRSTFAAVRAMVGREGLMSVYRGLSYPLLSCSLQAAVTFRAYGDAMRYLQGAPSDLKDIAGEPANLECSSGNKSTHSGGGQRQQGFGGTMASPLDSPPSQQQGTPISAQLHAAGSSAPFAATVYPNKGQVPGSSGAVAAASDASPTSSVGTAQQHPGGSWERALRTRELALEAQQQRQQQQQHPASMAHIYTAGMYAGLAQCFFMVPVELLKIRLQLQTAPPSSPRYMGALQMASHVVRHEGVLGLFRGTSVTLIRDLPSFGVYFAAYHGGCRWLDPGCAADSAAASPAVQLAAGGAAGVFSWFFVYPFDIIKSRFQAEPHATSGHKTWVHCAVATCRAEGWRAVFKGLGPTLVRALAVNAVTFAGYEACMKDF